MIFSNCEISRVAATSPPCLSDDVLAKGYGGLGKAHSIAIPRSRIVFALSTLDWSVCKGNGTDSR